MTHLKFTLRCVQFYNVEGALNNLNVLYVQQSGPDILHLPLLKRRIVPACDDDTDGSSNEPMISVSSTRAPAPATTVVGGTPWGCAHLLSSPGPLLDITDIDGVNPDNLIHNARNFAAWVSLHSTRCFREQTFLFTDVDGNNTKLCMAWSRVQYHNAVTTEVALLDVLYVKEDSADTISEPLPPLTKTVPPVKDGEMWRWKPGPTQPERLGRYEEA